MGRLFTMSNPSQQWGNPGRNKRKRGYNNNQGSQGGQGQQSQGQGQPGQARQGPPQRMPRLERSGPKPPRLHEATQAVRNPQDNAFTLHRTLRRSFTPDHRVPGERVPSAQKCAEEYKSETNRYIHPDEVDDMEDTVRQNIHKRMNEAFRRAGTKCASCHRWQSTFLKDQENDPTLKVWCPRCEITAYCSEGCRFRDWHDGQHRFSCQTCYIYTVEGAYVKGGKAGFTNYRTKKHVPIKPEAYDDFQLPIGSGTRMEDEPSTAGNLEDNQLFYWLRNSVLKENKKRWDELQNESAALWEKLNAYEEASGFTVAHPIPGFPSAFRIGTDPQLWYRNEEGAVAKLTEQIRDQAAREAAQAEEEGVVRDEEDNGPQPLVRRRDACDTESFKRIMAELKAIKDKKIPTFHCMEYDVYYTWTSVYTGSTEDKARDARLEMMYNQKRVFGTFNLPSRDVFIAYQESKRAHFEKIEIEAARVAAEVAAKAAEEERQKAAAEKEKAEAKEKVLALQKQLEEAQALAGNNN